MNALTGLTLFLASLAGTLATATELRPLVVGGDAADVLHGVRDGRHHLTVTTRARTWTDLVLPFAPTQVEVLPGGQTLAVGATTKGGARDAPGAVRLYAGDALVVDIDRGIVDFRSNRDGGVSAIRVVEGHEMRLDYYLGDGRGFSSPAWGIAQPARVMDLGEAMPAITGDGRCMALHGTRADGRVWAKVACASPGRSHSDEFALGLTWVDEVHPVAEHAIVFFSAREGALMSLSADGQSRWSTTHTLADVASIDSVCRVDERWVDVLLADGGRRLLDVSNGVEMERAEPMDGDVGCRPLDWHRERRSGPSR